MTTSTTIITPPAMPTVPEDGDIHARIEQAAREEAAFQAQAALLANVDNTSPNDTVCCGCRPKGRRFRRKKSSRVPPKPSNTTTTTTGSGKHTNHRHKNKTGSVYDDAIDGDDYDWKSMADSQYFFDAVEQELGPDEYPIVITNQPPSAPPFVTLDKPETLLLHNYDDDDRPTTTTTTTTSTTTTGTTGDGVAMEASEEVINHQHKHSSMRLQRILRRGTMEHKQQLESPRVKVPLRGYPGELTKPELEQCQTFIREIKQLPVVVSEQVYSLRDIEEEPYAICRFLRATKFNAEAMLQRLQENSGLWTYAKSKNFYPNVSEAIGAPFSVFLSQYPNVPAGRGRNGCPVNYFLAGQIQPEGLLCLTTVEKTQGYFWNQFMHKFVKEIQQAQKADENFVRCEGIQIIDLQGLSSSALSSDTFDVIKIAGKISDFFPETLHCMLIINAPGFFTVSWTVIRKFIDPRTARRIQVYSNVAKGLSRLLEMVDATQIPIDYGGTGHLSIASAMLKHSGNAQLKRQPTKLLHLKSKKSTDRYKFELVTGERAAVRVYTRSASSAIITLKHGESGEALEQFRVQAKFVDREEDEDETGILTATGVTMLPKTKNSSSRRSASDASMRSSSVRSASTKTSSTRSAGGRTTSSRLNGQQSNGNKMANGENPATGAENTNDMAEIEGSGDNDEIGNFCSPNCFLLSSAISGPGAFIVEAIDQDDALEDHYGQSRGYFLVAIDVT